MHIKEWIKDNIVIETDLVNKYSCESNNQYIFLRFIDEDKPFTKAEIYIPNEEDSY